jgi:hypothetical protein
MKNTICVIIPNWDAADLIPATINGLKSQTQPHDIIVVDNGSHDGSLALLRPMAKKGEIILIEHATNLGFTGGVNAGFAYALKHNYKAAASLNNDAVPDKNWLKYLYERLMSEPKIGTVTCKILSADGKTIDSTGDLLSTWGLPYPRGRGEPTSNKYDKDTHLFGASGGATIFKCNLLREVGFYDPDFFAYYEDTDFSLRTRLAGWQIRLEPRAFVLHQTSSTGNRVKGFTTLQTMKNLPWILVKDIPLSLLWRMYPRFLLAYTMFFGRAITDGRGVWALRGFITCHLLLPKKILERWRIQHNRVLPVADLEASLLHDLPPNAAKLRALRSAWWKLKGKK